MMFECFHCGARAVIWDADFDTEDYGYERPGIVHDCHCTHCGALIQYIIFSDDDDEE
jgi:hypothetical protein